MTAAKQTSIGRFKIFTAALLVCAALTGGFMLSANGQDADTVSPAGLAVHKLVIVKQDGTRETFRTEIAQKPIDIEIGLMHRKQMDSDAGMLFYFGGGEGEVNFWMKNTLIPLDMLFIRADGTIVHLHENAVPQSLERIPSRFPVAAVLELNGGEIAKRGFKAGDKVEHRFFHAAVPQSSAEPANKTLPPGEEPAPVPEALPDTQTDNNDVPSVIDDLQKPGLDSETGQP